MNAGVTGVSGGQFPLSLLSLSLPYEGLEVTPGDPPDPRTSLAELGGRHDAPPPPMVGLVGLVGRGQPAYPLHLILFRPENSTRREGN